MEDEDSFFNLIGLMNEMLPEDDNLFRRTLTDPRVKSSHGGGACPEQHEGELVDGRKFYFRMRHGNAQLHVAALGEDPLTVNPEYSAEAFDVAWKAGKAYDVPFYTDTVLHDEPYPDDQWIGIFENQKDRDACFKRCFDQIWAEG